MPPPLVIPEAAQPLSGTRVGSTRALELTARLSRLCAASGLAGMTNGKLPLTLSSWNSRQRISGTRDRYGANLGEMVQADGLSRLYAAKAARPG